MLDMSRTRIEKTREGSILSTVTIDQEGLCLQMVLSGGKEFIRPSNATANSLFLGFSWGERFGPPATITRTEVLRSTASAPTVTLSREASAAADMFVAVGTSYAGTSLASQGSSPSNVQFKLESDNKTVTLHADHADKDIFVVYRHALTVTEAQVLIGDAYPGQRTHAAIGRGGIIQGGYIYTDQFDASVNWANVDLDSEAIKGIANGRVGTGTGCSLIGYAHVVSAPSVGDPWLGLYVDH